jgi:uncharacterized membrane protein (DUF2068 family)
MNRPLGITLAAVVLTITGLFQVLVGLEANGITNLGLAQAADTVRISGGASLVSGILTITLAAGLFLLIGWARTLVVVVMAIRILVDVYTAATHGVSSTVGIAAITNLVISAAILWYFSRQNVKDAFNRD